MFRYLGVFIPLKLTIICTTLLGHGGWNFVRDRACEIVSAPIIVCANVPAFSNCMEPLPYPLVLLFVRFHRHSLLFLVRQKSCAWVHPGGRSRSALGT